MFTANYRVFFQLVYFILAAVAAKSNDESQKRITYISVEHPVVSYVNHKYIKYVNLTSKRYGRSNPVYYVDLNYESLTAADNNVKIDFYFYEYLTNQYKRSFVEMHFRYCNMIHNDLFFGAAMKQGKLDAPCPYPPGVYHLANMTVSPSAIPPGFPFTKGRIYCNISYVPRNEPLGSGYIDMEIRQMKIKNRDKGRK